MSNEASARVFDFHARLVPEPGAARRLLEVMDATGITRAAVVAGGVVDLDRLSLQIVEGGRVVTSADNDGVWAECSAVGDRLVPFFFGNPHRGADAYRRQAPRFRGLEISPAVHGVGLDDERTACLVEVAAEHAHPVYVVCLGRPGTRTSDLVLLARRFPGVTFVFGHCGFVGIDVYALAQIAPQRNIVAETSGCLTVVARLALERLGPDRVLFGTEYPLQHPTVELAKLEALALSAGTWEQIAWHNAHRLLGEEIS
jgi:predicted TIM-barrel fold metal-dependent hydrolase